MESKEKIIESETVGDQPLVDFLSDDELELSEEEEEIAALSSLLQDIARKFNGIESDLLSDLESDVAVMLEETGFLTYDLIDGKNGTYLYGM